MMEFGLFAAVVGIVCLVSFVWLLVVAFRQSLLWGFLVFLFSPISAIVFAVYYWYEARKPFLVYITATIIGLGLAFNMFNQMGGVDMFETAMQLEQGKISEAEAAKRMAEQMESNIDKLESAGVITPEERRSLQQDVQKLKLEDEAQKGAVAPVSPPTETVAAAAPASQPHEPVAAAGVEPAADMAESPAESAPKVGSKPEPEPPAKVETIDLDWSLDKALEKRRAEQQKLYLDLPQPRREGVFKPVSVARAEEHIGKTVRIDYKDSITIEGTLSRVDSNRVVVERQEKGGNVAYEMKRGHIRSMALMSYSDEATGTTNKKAGQ